MGVPRQGLRDLVEPLLGEGVCPAAHRVTDILPELLHRGHRVLSLLYSVRRYASLSNSKFLNTKPEACHVVLQNGVACRGEERGKGKHHHRLRKDREIRISGLVLLWLLGLKEIGEGILEVKIQKNCGLAFHPFLSLPKLTLRVGFQI